MALLPQPFPNPKTYVGHSGVDYPQGKGTRVRASGPGVVTFRGYLNPRAAYAVIVDYDDGPPVLYCHFDDLTDVPPVGRRVGEGDTIGRVGRLGLNSTGYHLHMEIMSGTGAHTFAGVWRYFSLSEVVGSSGGSTTPATPPTRQKIKRHPEMILFYTVDMKGELLFALAGASPGTSANWLETRDQDLANDYARATGVEVATKLSLPTYVAYQAKFLEPVLTA